MPPLPPNSKLKLIKKGKKPATVSRAPVEPTIAEKIALAADQEGMWARDIPRFPDLLVKYGIPLGVDLSAAADHAHSLERRKTMETLERCRKPYFG